MKLAEQAPIVRTGAAFAIAGALCVVVGVAAMWYTLWWFAYAAVLFIAAIVLGIVALARGNTGAGLAVVLVAVLLPLPLFFGLGWYRARDALQEAQTDVSTLARGIAQVAGLSSTSATGALPPIAEPPVTVVSESGQYLATSLLVAEQVVAGREPDALGEQVATVRFGLHNRGERTVSAVEVTVQYLDEHGHAIASDSFMPQGGELRLGPGERWSGDEAFTSPHVPAEWQVGSVRAHVATVQLEH